MKRMTHCEKWDDPWFRRLPVAYKCLWQFICDKCDASGVWKVDFETASYFVGATLTAEEALGLLKGRIHVLKSGYWLVVKFVDFQFGKLSSMSPPHKAVLKLIRSHTLELGYPKGRLTLQDKEKDKDKDRDKDKDKRGVQGGLRRFIKPTPQEVTTYATSIGFRLDGEKFVAHYESKGWVIGKAPMKNWRACVVTWKKGADSSAMIRPPVSRNPDPRPEDLPTAEDLERGKRAAGLIRDLAVAKAMPR